MEIRELQALVSVAQTASFTRAAEQLSLTQSAVTRQVAALESKTRTRLFDRLGRKVVLTAAGEVLQRYAVEMLRLDSEAIHAIEDVKSGVAGKLAVGASSTAAAYLLPPVLRQYQQLCPGVDLSVLTGPSRRVAEMVAGNHVDVGLLMDEPSLGGLTSLKVADYSIALIVYPEHELASRAKQTGASVSLEELSDLTLILMQSGASLRRSADELLGQAGHAPKIAMELDNVEAIKKMIEARLGASLLPIMSVKDETAAGTLVALRIDTMTPPRPAIVIVHRKEKYVSGAMKSFIELMRSKIRTS